MTGSPSSCTSHPSPTLSLACIDMTDRLSPRSLSSSNHQHPNQPPICDPSLLPASNHHRSNTQVGEDKYAIDKDVALVQSPQSFFGVPVNDPLGQQVRICLWVGRRRRRRIDACVPFTRRRIPFRPSSIHLHTYNVCTHSLTPPSPPIFFLVTAVPLLLRPRAAGLGRRPLRPLLRHQR